MLGFVRDVVIAALFGSDATTDAFFIAFRIPNFLRRLFAEGSFAQALVPTLMHQRESGTRETAARFVSQTGGSLVIAASGVTLAGVVAAPLLTLVFAPGFAEQHELRSLCSELVRITFPFVGLVMLTAFAGAVLNTYERFAIPAFTPALLNLTMIAAALLYAPRLEHPVYALGWSVTVAGVLQLALQLAGLRFFGLLPRPQWGFHNAEIRRIFAQMGPTVISTSVNQINVLLNTLLASFLTAGSISWLYYSDRLVEFPVGLLGVAISTVMLPQLARSHSRGNSQHFSASMDWSMRLVVVAALPASIGLIVCAKPLLFSLFQYDRFSPEDVEMTSRSLSAYALGIVGVLATKALLSGFTARHDFKTPFRFGLAAIALNLVTSAVLAKVFSPRGWEHAALGLGTSIGSALNAALLLRELLRSGFYRPLPGWTPLVWRVLIACFAMTGFLVALDPGATQWQGWSLSERLPRLALMIAGGIVSYLFCLWAGGLRLSHLSSPRFS